MPSFNAAKKVSSAPLQGEVGRPDLAGSTASVLVSSTTPKGTGPAAGYRRVVNRLPPVG